MRIPGSKGLQRLLSQAYVEATFALPAQYFTRVLWAKRMSGVGKSYLRKQVDDPVVRDKLTPRYAVGCKRPRFHNTYLSTFNRDNVSLVTEPIDNVLGTGVATTDGDTHDVDVLILATGFKVLDTDSVPTFPVNGAGGRSLGQFWDENPMQASEGVSIPGFPDIARCLTRADRRDAKRVEVSQEANARYSAEMMRKRHRQIFWKDSCALANSYYFDKNGDVPLRSATTLEAYWRSRRFDLADYRFCT